MPQTPPASDSWSDLFPTSGPFLANTLGGGEASSDNPYMQTVGQFRVALNKMLEIPRPELSLSAPVRRPFVSAPLCEIVSREHAQQEADRADPEGFVQRTFEECEAMCRMPWEGKPRFRMVDVPVARLED